MGVTDGKWVFYVDPTPIPNNFWLDTNTSFALVADFTQLSIFKLGILYNNNVPDNRLSDIYQDVDYANGSAIPVNFDLILNGQALKFPIPDSNYSQKSWSNGRYNGSRVSSPTFNR